MLVKSKMIEQDDKLVCWCLTLLKSWHKSLVLATWSTNSISCEKRMFCGIDLYTHAYMYIWNQAENKLLLQYNLQAAKMSQVYPVSANRTTSVSDNLKCSKNKQI